MTLTISDAAISSDQSAHTARLSSGHRHAWEVSWLPGWFMDRNSAITAMVLADTIGATELDAGHPLWPVIESWAEELGLTAPDAMAKTGQPPDWISIEEQSPAGPSDPEAAEP